MHAYNLIPTGSFTYGDGTSKHMLEIFMLQTITGYICVHNCSILISSLNVHELYLLNNMFALHNTFRTVNVTW